MNTAQKERIRQLRMEGVTYEKIADCLDLSVNTVKSFCQRNQLGGRKSILPQNIPASSAEQK